LHVDDVQQMQDARPVSHALPQRRYIHNRVTVHSDSDISIGGGMSHIVSSATRSFDDMFDEEVIDETTSLFAKGAWVTMVGISTLVLALAFITPDTLRHYMLFVTNATHHIPLLHTFMESTLAQNTLHLMTGTTVYNK